MTRPAIGFKSVRIVPVDGKVTKIRAVWDGGPKRAPRRGELYLSGVEVRAYEAPNDLNTEYYIARRVP